MTASLRWLVADRIVLQQWPEQVSLDTFSDTIEQTEQLIGTGIPPVHLICDLSNIRQYPTLGQLSRRMPHNAVPNIGWTLIVVQHPVLRFVASLLVRLAQARYRLVTTIEEAYQFLYRTDASLPPEVVA